MMLRKPFLLCAAVTLSALTLCALAVGCQNQPEPANQEIKAAAKAPEAFGATLTPGPSTPLAALIAKPEAFADRAIITEGKVAKACSRKGCWMELSDGDSKCRVTFKDYGFFVPTDSEGASARLQGTITTRTVSAGRVRHLEEEGAHFPNKQADGTATEVRLIATAVQLTR